VRKDVCKQVQLEVSPDHGSSLRHLTRTSEAVEPASQQSLQG
jgi:hypothetical protein